MVFQTLHQNREGNLDEFFSHENQGSPPSLSDGGIIRQGSKSDLIPCIEKIIETSDDKPAPSVLILDGAPTVQMLKPRLCKTFLEYSDNIFLPYLSSSMENVQRLDVEWDEHLAKSLKATTRAQRGKGARKRVLPSATIPQNWQTFLRSDENKKELFAFLSQQAGKIETDGKQVIVTNGKGVLCYPSTYTSEKLSPCSHEEADTRMMVHVADAVDKGHNSIIIRTVDTDVVVLAVAAVHTLGIKEIWVSFGTGKNHRILPTHRYASALGPVRSKSPPIFHALTGSDTTSFFTRHGKKTAWNTWETYLEVTRTFVELASGPSYITDETLATIERFIVLMYDRTSKLDKVWQQAD